MKKLFSVVFCLCICMSLSACKTEERSSEHIDEYESGYDYGYYTGYEQGLWDGAHECKEDFSDAVREHFFDVEGDTSRECGLHPEEAIMVLNDYLDGEYVSDAELETAIESITDFYYDWQSVIANIEDMDVDIYFD